jgi:hypothetical protein
MRDEEFYDVNKPLFIGELIRRVQDELVESQIQRESEGMTALFEVESLTVEVNFVVSASSTGKGGFDLKILTLGGENLYKEDQVHKITLTLKALSPEEDTLGLGSLEIEPSGRRPRRD